MTVEEVKKRLKVFTDMAIQLENKRERLRELEIKLYTPKTSQISDTPKAPKKGTSIQDDLVPIKDEITTEIAALFTKRENARKRLTASVDKMVSTDPREATIILMRYVDGLSWETINQAVFGKNEDYDERTESYMRRTFSIHGKALAHIAEYWTAHPSQAI